MRNCDKAYLSNYLFAHTAQGEERPVFGGVSRQVGGAGEPRGGAVDGEEDARTDTADVVEETASASWAINTDR